MMTIDRLDEDNDFLSDRIGRFGSFDDAIIERLIASFKGFAGQVDDFVSALIPDGSRLEHEQDLTALMRRMIVHLIVRVERNAIISPAALADAIGERNRRAVRSAGRLLDQRGVIVAYSEPSCDAEGERVLGYTMRATIFDQFDDYFERQNTGPVIDGAGQVKQ
jgi:hypothetical protein